MQRLVKFSKFRNIGLEQDGFFILNNTVEKGKLGNLLVVIGSNNSGKSNILDGIIELSNNDKLLERDITTLSFSDEMRKPTVSLMYKDEDGIVEYKLGLNGNKWSAKALKGKFERRHIQKPSIETIRNDLNIIKKLYFELYGVENQQLALLIMQIDNNRFSESGLYDLVFKNISDLQASNLYHQEKPFWDIVVEGNLDTVNYYLSEFLQAANDQDRILVGLRTMLGFNPMPKIYYYQSIDIKTSDLSTEDVINIEKNRFFNALFNAIGYDVKNIINAYAQFDKLKNSAILNKLKKEIEHRMDKLNDQFNKMYFASNDLYKFSVDFESDKILFGMARGKEEDPIMLEYQSTGFRWYFNLFFNFISNNTLKPGDIVIMDEPATNLHPEGQRELRRFIKEFAVKNDVLFIIATHSPFLVDPDNYDELRVISQDNNRSTIDNSFTAVNLNDPDSLLPIKDALTIKQNVLYDLDTNVVWVEGITDYNYLTLFKRILGYENIAFLPFNGVGNNNNQTHDILDKITKIKFYRCSLLVDADKAGMDMFNQAKDVGFATHNISEIDIGNSKPPMMIEDLFANEDKEKFPVISTKNALGTSEMKIHSSKEDFSEKTIENFDKLFKLLID